MGDTPMTDDTAGRDDYSVLKDKSRTPDVIVAPKNMDAWKNENPPLSNEKLSPSFTEATGTPKPAQSQPTTPAPALSYRKK